MNSFLATSKYVTSIVCLLLLFLSCTKRKTDRESQLLSQLAPFIEPHRGLAIGDRLCVFGGYDYSPEWLGDKKHHAATIVKFIPGQTAGLAAVVLKTDDEIKVGPDKGRYLVMETRWEGQDFPVHIERSPAAATVCRILTRS